MKRYVRRPSSNDYFIVVTDKNWDRFLDKIERETSLKVDSAYRRRRRGDNYIQLIDEDFGDEYIAEITEYTDGTYEFRSENLKHY